MKKLAKNMEEMFHKKSEAVRVSASSSCSVLPKDTKAAAGSGIDEPSSQRSKLTQPSCAHFLKSGQPG